MVNKAFPFLPVSTLAMFMIATVGLALLLQYRSRFPASTQPIVRASAVAKDARVIYLAGGIGCAT